MMDCFTYIENNGSQFWATGRELTQLEPSKVYNPDELSFKSKHKFDPFDVPDFSWYKHYLAEIEFPSS